MKLPLQAAYSFKIFKAKLKENDLIVFLLISYFNNTESILIVMGTMSVPDLNLNI